MKTFRGYLLTQWQTTTHKLWVAYYMLRLTPSIWKVVSLRSWFWRMLKHDWSKYKWDEARGFAQTIFDLKTSTYGSPEYKALLARLGPSLTLHYTRHDHHPEHWTDFADSRRLAGERPRGRAAITPYYCMSHIAKAEMLCDWAAAVRRHANGDLERSIQLNQKRFGYFAGEVHRLTCWAQAIGAIKHHD